jgi:hypothetical protein
MATPRLPRPRHIAAASTARGLSFGTASVVALSQRCRFSHNAVLSFTCMYAFCTCIRCQRRSRAACRRLYAGHGLAQRRAQSRKEEASRGKQRSARQRRAETRSAARGRGEQRRAEASRGKQRQAAHISAEQREAAHIAEVSRAKQNTGKAPKQSKAKQSKAKQSSNATVVVGRTHLLVGSRGEVRPKDAAVRLHGSPATRHTHCLVRAHRRAATHRRVVARGARGHARRTGVDSDRAAAHERRRDGAGHARPDRVDEGHRAQARRMRRRWARRTTACTRRGASPRATTSADTDTQTHRHTDTQSHRHTVTQTHRQRHTDTDTDTPTHRPTDPPTHRCTDVQTHRHRNAHKHRHARLHTTRPQPPARASRVTRRWEDEEQTAASAPGRPYQPAGHSAATGADDDEPAGQVQPLAPHGLHDGSPERLKRPAGQRAAAGDDDVELGGHP